MSEKNGQLFDSVVCRLNLDFENGFPLSPNSCPSLFNSTLASGNLFFNLNGLSMQHIMVWPEQAPFNIWLWLAPAKEFPCLDSIKTRSPFPWPQFLTQRMMVLSCAGISNNSHHNWILRPEHLDSPMKFTVMESAVPVVFLRNAPISVNYTSLGNQSRPAGPSHTEIGQAKSRQPF